MINKHPKLFNFFFVLFLIIVFLIIVYYNGCFFGMERWGVRGVRLRECTPPDWGSFETFITVIIEFGVLILFFIILGVIIVLPFYIFKKIKNNKK